MQEQHHNRPDAVVPTSSVEVKCRKCDPEGKSHDHTTVGCQEQGSSSDIIDKKGCSHGFEPVGDGVDSVDLVLEEGVSVS